MTTGIDGLISGLKTTDLINSLLAVEAAPQTLLKHKVSDTSSTLKAMQALNAQIASLATQAKTASEPDALKVFTTTSSSSGLTATASSTASTGSIDVVVGQLAQAQVGVTAAMPEWPTTPAVLTIVSQGGTPVEITPASSSLDDIVDAVNKSDTGVKAMKVASGSIAGVAQYRLQFSSAETGADGAFSVYQGASGDIGPAADLLAQPGAAVIHAAQDAEITLWSGTSAEQTITSASNSFSDLLPGVSVTVSQASSDPVTLTVGRDVDGSAKVASDLVDSLNAVFATISTKSAVVQSTSANGSSAVSGGVFTGDSTIRDTKDKLFTAASMPVNGVSPSEIGIVITKTGTLEFDKEKFAAAMADSPQTVQAVMQEISSRVADAATTVSDKYSGTLTTKITGEQSVIDSLNDQITDWDSRLSARRAALEKMYAAMEVQLSNMNAQASNLAGQIAGLPSWSSGS